MNDTRVSPSLVEAAVRTMREWGVPGTDGGLTILAEEVLAAVGDALRLEGAQAEHARIVANLASHIERARNSEMRTGDLYADLLLAALGGVHPEASDG